MSCAVSLTLPCVRKEKRDRGAGLSECGSREIGKFESAVFQKRTTNERTGWKRPGRNTGTVTRTRNKRGAGRECVIVRKR